MFGHCSRQNNAWKGLAAGLIGGLAASYVMERFQSLWIAISDAAQDKGHTAGGNAQPGRQQQPSEPATVRAAEMISERFFDVKLSEKQKRLAGPVVHYAFGTAVAGGYGVLTEFTPAAAAAAGLPFGAAVWLGMDELGLWAMGLSKRPDSYPLSSHGYALASHLVYGLTTDVVRRIVRRSI